MFYLETPSINREEEAKQFLYETSNNDSNLEFLSGLDKILTGISYEDWLYLTNKLKDKEYASKIEKNPAYTYFFIREKDNKIIGIINISYIDNKGYINYTIRPSERKKGYSKILLYLGLLVSNTIGLDEVELGCTSESCNRVTDQFGGIRNEVNVINVEKSLEKNKEYNNYLVEGEVIR